ncbi:Unknown protein, partial [Striga hermonthica]
IMNTRNNRNCQPSPSPSPPHCHHQAPPAMDLTQLIVQFQRMNAPTFAGTENPTTVLEWIKELDKIFAVMVRGKFLHQSFWDRMDHEFYHLQQGSSTVDEYIRTFTRTCLFAGDSVNTDAKKARKFLKGLNQRIRELGG